MVAIETYNNRQAAVWVFFVGVCVENGAGKLKGETESFSAIGVNETGS